LPELRNVSQLLARVVVAVPPDARRGKPLGLGDDLGARRRV